MQNETDLLLDSGPVNLQKDGCVWAIPLCDTVIYIHLVFIPVSGTELLKPLEFPK